MNRAVDLATITIIFVSLAMILASCQGNRFGYYNPNCDIKGVEKLCK